jgi:hypothetical protein
MPRTLSSLDVVQIAEKVGEVIERRDLRLPGGRLLYTFEHAAELLDCSASHVRELTVEGALALHKDPDAGRNSAARITGKSLREYVRRFDQSRIKNHRAQVLSCPETLSAVAQ